MYPTLFEIPLGSFSIPIHTYGLMIAIGFFLAVATIRRLSVKSKMDPDKNADLAFWLLLVGLLGGRTLFVITRWSYFSQYPLEIFKIWEGGLVFFGGLISGMAFLVWYFLRNRLNLWKMLDVMGPTMAIGHGLGRLGCFGAGCCHGRPTDMPWGISLHSELVDAPLRGIPLHPTQLYESFSLILVYFGLLWLFERKKFDGQVGLTYFMVYPVLRSVIEIYRGDSVRGFIIGDWLSTSQFISILVFIAALVTLVIRLKVANDSPVPAKKARR